ncbi:exocyst complex component 3-like protein 4 isoform X3 [Falco biarmicus]|uniref:exocyst complex component 3-like protein 4 isoform X3 n=1 Tax=Falco peregrinus TaxID=8954 RepID=UPI0018868DE7|nr:exocyst complex component 3-like protein 4 isoform X3 [Falco peregrinus]XP_027659272.2 exocyst complex component 3-like protein 4 isoform X3 [Falco cherrug]XP_037250507.1 exocyst complex component 3-like protein 4 isoform X3 [Falco rusticolus]XP_056203047.1 exocyst complex component 3-like protein 4 isoform X3 [Falco biarmicus]
MDLDSRSMTSEPASPMNGAGEEKTEAASELSSPAFHSRDSGFFERGIKTMLSIRKSKQSLNKEKGKEGTGTWKGKRLSLRLSKSYDEKKNTVCNGVEDIGEKIEAESIQGKPLSVMEINELIQKGQLLEAFANIKYLEDETITERDAEKYKDNPQELVRKSKDVDLLYNSITNMIQSIVVGTLEHPTVENATLTSLVTLIAREEAAHPNTGNAAGPGSDLLGTPRKWREEWKEAINESARKRVLRVPMASKEEESSWLDLHLGFLQKCLSEDLLKIKLSVKKCYPEEYQVCDVYVEAFHKAIASHLQDLSRRPLEFNELYTLLDWVANVYRSELFLGHPDLKPEVKTENLSLLLAPADWDKLKTDYIASAKGKIKSYFGNILRLEVTEKWEKEVHPEVKENLYHSSLSFDIQTIIGEHMKISGVISRSLEMKMLELCLAELQEFIPRFGEEFMAWSTAQDSPIFAPCFAAYINSFHDLASGLETMFKVNTEELQKILEALTRNFTNIFFNKLRTKVQELLRDVHKYVVKEYIMQVIKPRRKMNRETRQQVSEKMNQEARILNNMLIDQGSDSDWLLPAIHHIADIIGEKKKDKIKEYVKELCQHYPDIRKEHVLAVLALRGLGHTRRAAILRQGYHALESPDGGECSTLFAEIDAPLIISCF